MLTLPEALRGTARGSPRTPSLILHRGPGSLPTVTIHVFSDVACPWCHIGTRRLQRAARQYKRRYGQAAPLKLHWNPLLVDSDVSTVGEDVESYADLRWGQGSGASWRARLVRAGLPEGAAFANWKVVPNSLLAHELVLMAADVGLAEQANDLLFARTYEQGRNISLLGELLDIGEALGMQRAAVRKELLRGEGGALRASVLERDAAAKQRLRIQAVPHFIIAAGPASRTKYALNGSHATSDLLGAMERVAAEEARAGALGGALGIPPPPTAAAAAAPSYNGLLAAASPLTVAAPLRSSRALAAC